MTRRVLTALVAVLVAAPGVGCGDGAGPSEGFVVAGPVSNNTGSPVPDDARVIVAWVVSSGPSDYTYVFGEGSLNSTGNSFGIRLDRPPPAAALNAGVLGVGIVVATTSQFLETGDDLAIVPDADLIGAAGAYGVIYIGDPEGAAQVRGWAAEFEAGYNVGIGVAVPDDFDKFVPTSPTDVILIIDDLENIEFVDWT